MTLYHFQCIVPLLLWCLIGAVACWKNDLM